MHLFIFDLVLFMFIAHATLVEVTRTGDFVTAVAMMTRKIINNLFEGILITNRYELRYMRCCDFLPECAKMPPCYKITWKALAARKCRREVPQPAPRKLLIQNGCERYCTTWSFPTNLASMWVVICAFRNGQGLPSNAGWVQTYWKADCITWTSNQQ